MKVDELIAEAARLPLHDAAYALWRQKSTFERLELRQWEPRDMSTPEARERSMREISAEIKHERDFAQDGPTFDRLKRAHPEARDDELKQAIVAAVTFDTECFRNFRNDRGDFWERVVRAVARAARRQPDYLETTYRDARNHVAYYEK